MKMALENPWVGLISKSSKETTKLPAEKWLKVYIVFPEKSCSATKQQGVSLKHEFLKAPKRR